MIAQIQHSAKTYGPKPLCPYCGEEGCTGECGRGNVAIADKIGFLYDADTGEWYNRSCQLATEQDAGFCAHYAGIPYADMTSAGMRSGWLDASGFEGYCASMQRQRTPALVAVDTAQTASATYRVRVYA